MKNIFQKQTLKIIASTALLALPCAGNAQTAAENFPTKPVRIIAPFPPGGSVDTVGRLVAARLSESYGQTFVIDNRSGASGSIGMEIAANSPGDGYTLVVNTLPLVTNQFLFSKVPYDALRAFI
ncbi:MAG TPA: tripartite tricarboxylate transporter substrate-binding protein, partial [Burkholderiales bacterium]|nr:tripartite tricarboxylate transporter substrate-binding protein [Burkholderiales bacterium]